MEIRVKLSKVEAEAVSRAELSVGWGVRKSLALQRAQAKLHWAIADAQNPPASVTHPTHTSDPAQVGTTGRLDVKTAQTGAQQSNERNE